MSDRGMIWCTQTDPSAENDWRRHSNNTFDLHQAALEQQQQQQHQQLQQKQHQHHHHLAASKNSKQRRSHHDVDDGASCDPGLISDLLDGVVFATPTAAAAAAVSAADVPPLIPWPDLRASTNLSSFRAGAVDVKPAPTPIPTPTPTPTPVVAVLTPVPPPVVPYHHQEAGISFLLIFLAYGTVQKGNRFDCS